MGKNSGEDEPLDEVGEVLDVVDGVENTEAHTRPVAHEEAKRGASFRG